MPIFWKLIERWPTPDALAQGNPAHAACMHFKSSLHPADRAELEASIRCLGLQSTRAKRLIALSAAYLDLCPPEPFTTTPVSHLPGSGPYALDSYRIYCGGPGAWRTVMPRDKELVRYIVCSPPFFVLVYRLTRDRSIEMALGYGRHTVVTDTWCDGPRQRDVPRTAHT